MMVSSSNLFPYDNIAEVHDLLMPKRVFGKMAQCKKEEWKEYKTIINQLENERYYDVIIENFSRNKTVPIHLHLHLIIWKKMKTPRHTKTEEE